MFLSAGKFEHLMKHSWKIATATPVRQTLHQMKFAVKKKKKKGLKSELSIYQVIYILPLTYCHKLWLVTERIRLILRERARSSG